MGGIGQGKESKELRVWLCTTVNTGWECLREVAMVPSADSACAVFGPAAVISRG
jgi:hypothetical protein